MKDKSMKTLLRLEEIGLIALGCYFFSLTGYSWWIFILLFLAPDIGMVGYLVNVTTGAFIYNLFHHKGLAAVVVICGLIANEPILILAGSVLFSHAAFDRVFGYGLKFSDSFKHTHLGWIGKTEKNKL